MVIGRLQREDIDVLILGHSHAPGEVRLPGGTYVNTGSWTYADSTYVIVDRGIPQARRWPSDVRIRDEEYRGILGPHGDKTFFDWWEAFYRGRFRYDVDGMIRAAHGETFE